MKPKASAEQADEAKQKTDHERRLRANAPIAPLPINPAASHSAVNPANASRPRGGFPTRLERQPVRSATFGSPATSRPVWAKELRCLRNRTAAANDRPLPTRKRCCFTARAGPASSKSSPPSRWRPSATCRSPIRPASRCRCWPSPRTRIAPTTTPPRAISSPSSPTAPPSWGLAIAARSPPSR